MQGPVRALLQSARRKRVYTDEAKIYCATGRPHGAATHFSGKYVRDMIHKRHRKRLDWHETRLLLTRRLPEAVARAPWQVH